MTESERKALWRHVYALESEIKSLKRQLEAEAEPTPLKFNYGNVNKESARNASLDLFGSFSWAVSPEGYRFWQRINDRLREISDGALPQTSINTGP